MLPWSKTLGLLDCSETTDDAPSEETDGGRYPDSRSGTWLLVRSAAILVFTPEDVEVCIVAWCWFPGWPIGCVLERWDESDDELLTPESVLIIGLEPKWVEWWPDPIEEWDGLMTELGWVVGKLIWAWPWTLTWFPNEELTKDPLFWDACPWIWGRIFGFEGFIEELTWPSNDKTDGEKSCLWEEWVESEWVSGRNSSVGGIYEEIDSRLGTVFSWLGTEMLGLERLWTVFDDSIPWLPTVLSGVKTAFAELCNGWFTFAWEREEPEGFEKGTAGSCSPDSKLEIAAIGFNGLISAGLWEDEILMSSCATEVPAGPEAIIFPSWGVSLGGKYEEISSKVVPDPEMSWPEAILLTLTEWAGETPVLTPTDSLCTLGLGNLEVWDWTFKLELAKWGLVRECWLFLFTKEEESNEWPGEEGKALEVCWDSGALKFPLTDWVLWSISKNEATPEDCGSLCAGFMLDFTESILEALLLVKVLEPWLGTFCDIVPWEDKCEVVERELVPKADSEVWDEPDDCCCIRVLKTPCVV